MIFSPTTLLSTFQVNKELFHIVYDMIAVLLHHTLGGDSPSCQEGSKREYLNIVKKNKGIASHGSIQTSVSNPGFPEPETRFFAIF